MKNRILSPLLSFSLLAGVPSLTAFASADIAEDEAEATVASDTNVRFVNGSASSNGNGLTASSPYKSFSSAANDLKDSGGTIVITGPTTNSTLNNTGDIVVTSNYGGVDYRTSGAYLTVYTQSSTPVAAYMGTPGKITFTDIDTVGNQWDPWYFNGHEVELTDTFKVYTTSAKSTPNYRIQMFPLFSSENFLPDKHTSPINIHLGNENSVNLILGGREELEIGDVNVVVDGWLRDFVISNNTDEGGSADYGQLTVNGNVKLTVNGTVEVVKTRTTVKSKGTGLKAFNGDLAVIVNHGGSLKNGVNSSAKPTNGNWYVVNGAQGGTLSHGEGGGDFILATESTSYNTVVLTNTTTENTYAFVIDNGRSEFTLTESGSYSMEYTNSETVTVSFEDTVCGSTVAPIKAVKDGEITLPTLENNKVHAFLGWADNDDDTEPDYLGGEKYTASASTTLYAIWSEEEVYTVSFVADGEVFDTYSGIAGTAIEFPDAYPEKEGFYFKKWNTDETVIGSSDITVEAIFVSAAEAGLIYYVNPVSGNNSNSGLVPSKAFADIDTAIALLRNVGGSVVVTGGIATLSGEWNNSKDIRLTSVDPVSGADYRATELTADKTDFKNGARIWYKGGLGFGTDTITGGVILDHLTMVKPTKWDFMLFKGHPYELGEGISVYHQASTGSEITAGILTARSLGGTNDTKTNPEGIKLTLNTVKDSVVIYAIGTSSTLVPGLDITVNSEVLGNLCIGNDYNSPKTTIQGPVKFTFNANVQELFGNGSSTNPIEGNIYALYNNGATTSVASLPKASGYGVFAIYAKDNITLSHAKNEGSFIATYNGEDSEGKYAAAVDSDERILSLMPFVDGKAELTLTDAGTYNVVCMDEMLYKVSYDTGLEGATIPDEWVAEGTEITLRYDIKQLGKIISGWTDGNETYTGTTYTVNNGNVTLTAIWSEAPRYTADFSANGANVAVPESMTGYVDETIVLPRVTCNDATFLGWSTDKNAESGTLSHVLVEDTTLYAITTTEPAYVLESYFRGDPEDYTGPRCHLRRYIIDVYLENAAASEGSLKLDTDNGFLYYLGNIPIDGITATVDAPEIYQNQGLQSKTTKAIELSWKSEGVVDALQTRKKVARIMMYFSSWGMGYSEIEKRTTDEVVSAYAGYTASADGETALVSANIYKGVRADDVKLSGTVTVEGREVGTSAAYDLAELVIFDSEGDAVESIRLEEYDSDGRSFEYSTKILPGEYTVSVNKDGYLSANVMVNVTEDMTVPEIILVSGDTLDENGVGDGIVNIDDFERVLRGFADSFPKEKYINAIDLNEDGSINVSDLAIIKRNYSVSIEDGDIQKSVNTDDCKAGDWSISTDDDGISIVGGGDKAIESALAYLESSMTSENVYSIPTRISHTGDYELSDIRLDGVSTRDYRIVIAENDAIAEKYAKYIKESILDKTGFTLEIVYDDTAESGNEIIVGETSRGKGPITASEEYKTYEKNGKLYVYYGDEQSAELACIDLCTKILGTESEGYDGFSAVDVVKDTSCEGSWSVLARFGVMSDSHVDAGSRFSDYEWLYNTFDNLEAIHKENPLDFVVSLGDNIDDGYTSTYQSDYSKYLEEMKRFAICDPVNPVEGREEGMIPHYEICGNHDPIGGEKKADGTLKIRFFKNKLWYTENEKGEKVAYVAFFTDYGGYPLYHHSVSGSTESYRSYGIVNDEMVEFVEDSIVEANANGAKHIILYNHWGISLDVSSPTLPETGLGKIASVCEKYNVKLYFNGHEHDEPYSLRRYEDIYDVAMTNQKHAVVEITTLRAKVTIYYSSDNSLYREDIVPLGGYGEAVQTFAK